MTFNLALTDSMLGLSALMIFILAYALVMSEELIHLRKSKPVLLAAGLMWFLVAWAAQSQGQSNQMHMAIKHNLLDYAELLLFLLVAMTYINVIEERGIFNALRGWLLKKQFSYRQLYWITGFLAFFISPIADNMTTALLMCSVILALGHDKPKFVSISCINIVVAANAGGAFSPFGDITTLMVWQAEILKFNQFFNLFIPSLVNYLVPAAIMQFAVPRAKPEASRKNPIILPGGISIVWLFLLTIATSVLFHQYLSLPPTVGMMMGLAYLQFFSYYLKYKYKKTNSQIEFDVFQKISQIEWDTLLFFYGVILCVGALAALGYLQLTSENLYQEWGANLSEIHRQTPANIVLGVLSAIVDNIPLMFAVLTMSPVMSEGQWLLITLTTGVGGSLLSIGSAAGVALMGQAKGKYTFLSHLKWSWAILLGYFASIATHCWLNKGFFNV